jgi:membrane-associated protease RseP (regulator of RpoE activity)
LKILGRIGFLTVMHIKKRFFGFIDWESKSLIIAELTKKPEINGKILPELPIHRYFGEIEPVYVKWEMRITPIHIILFILTGITTTIAGAMMQGISPISKDVWKGLYFSIPLLFILSCHEFGHIYSMWKHSVKSTFPFFIPAPNIVGTFGAIMVLRERVEKSSEIIRIGSAGPIAGFIAAIPIALIGLKLSNIVDKTQMNDMLSIKLGTPIILSLMQNIIFGKLETTKDIILHPVAFAGWIGFFITAMNLIPIGQTDGGHIIFGLFPKWHRKISFLLVAILFVLGILFWYGWLFWATLTAILGIRKIPYTPIKDIKRSDKILALISLIIFILTFIVSPIQIEF